VGHATLLFISAVTVLGACTSHGSAPPSACSDLVNVGDKIRDTHVTTPMPNPTGGAIADGTYVRIASTYYDGGGDADAAQPHTRQETWSISGNSAQRIYQRDTDPVETQTFTFVIAGTNLVESSVCPDQSAFTFGFDATPTTIRRYNFRYDEVITYSRR
jgi:hypothetical protein